MAVFCITGNFWTLINQIASICILVSKLIYFAKFTASIFNLTTSFKHEIFAFLVNTIIII